MRYPEAPRSGAAERRHGRSVADPYRWLERDDASTRAWTTAQDELAGAYFDRLDGACAQWRQRQRELTRADVGVPRECGGRSFLTRRAPDAEHSACVVVDADGQQRTLLDPAVMSARGTVTLDAFTPSPDGRLLAYQVSEGGDDRSWLQVCHVDTLADTGPPIPVGWAADVAWLPDSTGFYYQRAGRTPALYQVWRHLVDETAEHDSLVVDDFGIPGVEFALSVSPSGHWLSVTSILGSNAGSELRLVDLRTGERTEVVTGSDCLIRAHFGPGDQLYLLTTLDAPRWRLAVADPADPVPERWRTLVAEGEDFLYAYQVTVRGILTAHRRHVVSRVSLHDPTRRRAPAAVEIPGPGAVDVGGGRRSFVTYTDHTTPTMLLRLDADTGRLVAEDDAAPTTSPATGVDVVQLFATSPDGTRIPMFVLSPAGIPDDRPLPTVLEGYGGWNVPFLPRYAPQRLAWVRAGGRYVVTNLRGGGEYGAQWFLDGMRARQQNPVDDFLACAHRLVEMGRTTPSMLGALGGSKGGLTVGAAITQEPETFGAAVMSAPMLDMVRYEQLGNGAIWSDGFGTAEDPEQFGWLAAISAYHRVRPGVGYPACLLMIFDNDTRVHPAHARKMCAALQYGRGAAEPPVLLRRKPDAGHAARSAGRMRDLHADQLAFLADQLGMAQPA